MKNLIKIILFISIFSNLNSMERTLRDGSIITIDPKETIEKLKTLNQKDLFIIYKSYVTKIFNTDFDRLKIILKNLNLDSDHRLNWIDVSPDNVQILKNSLIQKKVFCCVKRIIVVDPQKQHDE